MKVLDLIHLQKLHHIVKQEPVVKYITWGLVWDPFKGYLKQSKNFKIVQNMDIDLNSNGNSKQVGNLTVLIGSDPFLPQSD